MIAPPSRKIPPKAFDALGLALQGVRNRDIAKRLGLSEGTVGAYLHWLKAAGYWTPKEIRNPPTFIALKPANGRAKRFLVSISTDVAGDLIDEAKRRDRPAGTMLAALITAAVDRGLVADLLDND